MFQIKKVPTQKTPKHTPTRHDVERYVEKFDRSMQSPLERKSKSFAIARLYYEAKEYDQAKRRLEEYLSIQDRDYRVHNLMGEIQEALKNYPEALSAYKRSLELCSTQKDVLVKVISLCCKCPLDPLRAKVWADKGSRFCPGHPAVFELKWCIMSQANPKDFEQMEILLADELTRRAREPSLHVKLVEMYMEAESYKRAFLHCQSVEKTSAFDGDLGWLETACNVFDEYRQISDNSLTACLCFSLTLIKLINLHMKLSTSRIVQPILQRFDSAVLEFSGLQNDNIQLSPEWKDCISEMKGQLYLHAAFFIMKLAQDDTISWMKANRMACVFLLASWGVEAPYMTSKLFSRHSPLKRLKSTPVYDWSVQACFRFSQTGHLLLSMESQFGENWLKDCLSDFCTEQGRRKLLEHLFCNTNENTYLAGDVCLLNTEVLLPEPQKLVQYDEVTVSEHAQDLNLIIWLGLHWDRIKEHMKPGVGVMVGRLFEGISLDVKNMTNCHFSSMCLRDVEAFIYGVIRSSKSLNVECSREEDILALLPVGICGSLVTEQEKEWWYSAYGLYTGKVGTQSAAKLKVVMQKGLEVLRCLRNHGIDPRILIYIAVAFWEKAVSVQSTKERDYDYQDHWQSLQNRAVYYMKEALRILGIYKKNKTIPVVENPLIPPLAEPLLPDAINDLWSKNYQKLGESAMLTGNLQDALTYFDEVNSLQSFHTQAQIYIQLASACDTETLAGEKDHLFYTTKAKEKLIVCINNSAHAPDFKHSVVDQLRKLEGAGTAATLNKPYVMSSKKCLDFEDGDLGIAANEISQDSFANSGDVSAMFERSMLQDQLEAKEKENRVLKQALAMYKAHIDLQQRQQQQQQEQYFSTQQPVMVMTTPRYVMPHGHPPPQITPHMVQNSNSFGSVASGATPVMTVNGLETPTTDMWWDSFSPQPSFEKGYFAGLAEHVEQVREESGEGEAPTLRDPTTTTPLAEKKLTPNVSVNSAGTPIVESDDIYVEPIVKLTSKSDLVTGEEDEITKFVHRAKLYRFDKETSQWKERGLGDVKILLNERSKKSRITMRREAVFRVCCNHFITPDMCLESKANAKAAWTWFTLADAAEGEVRPEQLTIKFKTQEVADKFKDAFLECQKIVNGGDVVTSLPTSKASAGTLPQSAPFTFQLPQTIDAANLSTESNVTGFTFGAPTTQVSYPPPLSHFHQSDKIDETPQSGTTKLDTSGGMASNINSGPGAFSTFSFKALPDAISESSAGKPIFSFPAVSQQHNQNAGNPFLMKQVFDDIPLSTSESDMSSFQSNTFREVEESSAEVKPSPFQNLSFKLPASAKDSQSQVISPATMSHFAGFSFAAKGDAITDSSKQNLAGELKPSVIPLTQNFPMMTSLLKDQPKTPPKQGSGSPKPEAIPGMNKLPVFEKGLVETGIDPSSFWTSVSPQKPFFTGNNTGLDAIGHKEEPRVVDEEEFFKDAMQASNDFNDEIVEQYGNGESYYGNEYNYYEDKEYYGDEFYDNYDDYDYDPDDDLENYENVYQGSRASSGRRDSTEDDDYNEINSSGWQTDERFGHQNKSMPTDIADLDEEVTVTFENKPNFAQKMKASRFQLPPTFYLYEQKPDCPGCYGCVDNFVTQKKNMFGEKTVTDNREATNFSSSQGLETQSSSSFVTNERNLFNFGSKSGSSSFAALATTSTQGFGGISGSFSGAGAQLFSAKGDVDGEVEESYDPHYDAIVQVDKIENVSTGEEDDEVLFKHRAKLYRYDQQWKERGVGDLKLTRNVKTGYCRVLMRRDMIYKLCANHAIMPNMDLRPLSTSDRSAIWFTPSDYSEGMPPVAQNFCAKFKNKSVVDEFMKEFENCKELMRVKFESEKNLTEVTSEPTVNEATHQDSVTTTSSDVLVSHTESPSSSNPFFSFGKSQFANTQSPFHFGVQDTTAIQAVTVGDPQAEPLSPGKYNNTDDPDIQVEAIVAVQKLGKVMTGEEHEEILFADRGKLFRFDSEARQWKEKGIGEVKLSRNKIDNTCRVLMRREQIFKLCANHSILVDMQLKPLNKSDKAWVWFTPADFSDEEAKPEQLALKLKNRDVALDFKEKFERCKEIVAKRKEGTQTNLSQEPKEAKAAEPVKGKVNIFAKFAPKPGSWTCETCLVPNEAESTKCVACTAPNPSATPASETSSFSFGSIQENPEAPIFKFGSTQENPQATSFSFGLTQDKTEGASFSFGSTQEKSQASSFSFGSTQDKPQTASFSFGLKQEKSESTSFVHAPEQDKASTASLNSQVKEESSDPSKEKVNIFAKFPPKPGSWTCETCLITNEAESAKCVACTAPNPSATQASETSSFSFGSTQDKPQTSSFSFGLKQEKSEATSFVHASEQDKASTASSNSHVKEESSDPLKGKVNIFAKFAPKPGSWTCETCLITNEAESTKCIACTAPNPSATQPTDTSSLSFGSTQDKPQTTSFSFGLTQDKPQTTPFSFGSTQDKLQTTSFSFGSTQDKPQTTSFSFGSTQDKPQTTSFSFGSTQDKPQTTSFSFGSKPDKSESSSFSFGLTQNEPSPSSFSFGSQKESLKPEFDSDKKVDDSKCSDVAVKQSNVPSNNKFEADPNTWECPSCLAKNDGYREHCRNCHNVKEKTPVVKLDPALFSTPVPFNPDITGTPAATFTSQSGSAPPAAGLFITPAESPKAETSSAGGFFLAKKGESDGKSTLETEAADRVLMPPPTGLPPKTKTSPKQNSKKTTSNKDSVFSWMPQGLNTETLFTFGSTPSPSLSAASSVDDIPAQTSDNVPSAFSNTSFTFKLEKELSTEPKTPDAKSKMSPTVRSPVSPKTPGDGDDNDNDSQFVPIVSLEHVMLGTGEEDEEVLFKERSKMFRFDKQWKERGIGELRILRNRKTQQHRLIMRREQIHKLCANHGLIQGMTIKPMTGNRKAYTWKTGADISDGDVKEQMFAARFKDEETACRFAKIFEEACSFKRMEQNIIAENKAVESTESEVIIISDSEESVEDNDVKTLVTDATDVKVTFDAIPDSVLTKRAKELLLPKTFFNEPSVCIGVRPSRTVGETSEAATSPTVCVRENELAKSNVADDLILTHELVAEKSAQNKANSMLLPKSFYNCNESGIVALNEVIEIDKIQEEIQHELPRSYVKNDLQREVFRGSCTLFSFIGQPNDYRQIAEGDVIILCNQEVVRTEVVVVSENKIFYQKEVSPDLKLTLLPDSKTMFELKQSIGLDGHVVKFPDMLTAESFQFNFEEACKPVSHGNVFGGSGVGLSFASVAAGGPSAFESNSGKSFAGSGSSLFMQNNVHNDDEEESTIYVEPLVQLTTVAVSNGEEEETVVFNQRCKLYRFDSSSKKWKERGVGNLKLLQHKLSGKSRLLMRREQVGKLCANHQLNAELKLEPFKTNELTVTWHAVGDMSDSVPEDCILAARFKNRSILKEVQRKIS